MHEALSEAMPQSRRQVLAVHGRALVRAIRTGDEAAVETAVLELSRSRRIFAPLVFAVGAFVMLFDGLRLLFSNWRLTLVQILPAMWIWAALLDLKAHAFKGAGVSRLRQRGRSRSSWRSPSSPWRASTSTPSSRSRSRSRASRRSGPGSSSRGKPRRRPRGRGRRRRGARGSAIVVPRWGTFWFALSLGIVIGVMMLTYVTVPARIAGIQATGSRRDKLAAAVSAGRLERSSARRRT